MAVRLGFAVASALEPDVLLLDEVLAVGDGAFKFKCYRRMDDLLKKSAVIFVTHDMPQLSRICSKALVLKHGSEFFQGVTCQGVEAYHTVNKDVGLEIEKMCKVYHPVRSFAIVNFPCEIESQSRLSFGIEISSEEPIGAVTLRIDLKNQSGAFAASCLVPSEDFDVFIEKGENFWEIRILSLPLKPGSYLFGISFSDQSGALIAVSSGEYDICVRGGYVGIVPDCQLIVSDWNKSQEQNAEDAF